MVLYGMSNVLETFSILMPGDVFIILSILSSTSFNPSFWEIGFNGIKVKKISFFLPFGTVEGGFGAVVDAAYEGVGVVFSADSLSRFSDT